jgi:RNA polymerase sigma-70 factor (ECF subfamily)
VAEDLAQETLLEAWRNRQKLSTQDLAKSANRVKWLMAIARNICLRWGRSHGRDLAHLTQYMFPAAGDVEQALDLDELPTGSASLDIELERDELAQLLDRALALLPPTTRSVLIERYIHESPHAEIAERLGLNEDALVQRLYRGKLALRQVMEHELNAEAAAYGLVNLREEEAQQLEQETRIWCPLCNTNRLIKYYDSATTDVSFVCPGCWQITRVALPPLLKGLHSPKSILNRQLAYLGEFYWRAINHGEATCLVCGCSASVRILICQEVPEMFRSKHGDDSNYGVSIRCSSCEFAHINLLTHLTIDIPESQKFWRQHPRIRWLPACEIDYAGQPALLSGFQSSSDSARLDIIYQRATLKILGIHETTC